MYLDLDGKVDAFGVGGVDLYLRLDEREYPLHAALKLVPVLSRLHSATAAASNIHWNDAYFNY